MNPLGTILYGGKSSADDKRLKLEIILQNLIKIQICVESLDISDLEKLIL
jgi:hypothetical protein